MEELSDDELKKMGTERVPKEEFGFEVFDRKDTKGAADPSARCAFVYRKRDGGMIYKKKSISELPSPGEKIEPETQRVSFDDLIKPSDEIFRKIIQDLLDKVVIDDTNVTRREDQLDQLCNMLLLKLESDKRAKTDISSPVFYRAMENSNTTASMIKEKYSRFVDLYPDTFITEQDKVIRFNNDTIYKIVEAFSGLRLIDLGVSSVSVAFQVLRSEALKQGEGQYFTPQAVINAGIKLLDISWDDIVLDPACGTGGFLVEAILQLKEKHPDIDQAALSKWAQTHIFGIEKDAIGLKLTKAIMQIAGDGSAHCVRGDSIRVHNWFDNFPYLRDGMFKNNRFAVIATNPPFGQNLKVSAEDSRLSGLDIAKGDSENYKDMEIGILFLQRSYQWLRKGGRLGIVLPETYFFSTNYLFLQDWIKQRLKPLVVANIPMEAFQGYCRAKTNFYVFEKIG